MGTLADDVIILTIAAKNSTHGPVVDAFNEKHPNIRVQLDEVIGDYDRIMVQYATQTGPDIQFLEWYEHIDRFIDAGVFMPLTPFIDRDYMLDDILEIPEPVTERFSREGNLYAIPEYLHMRGVGINRTFREEAGLALPESNWDWDDFAEFALKLRRVDADGHVSRPGTGINAHWAIIQGWLGGTGMPVHDPDDPGTINLLAPEHIEALEFLQEINRAHAPYVTMAEGILAGNVAMQDNMASNYAPIMHDSPFDFDVVETPVGPGGTRVVTVNDGSFYINKDSNHPEEAWEFLKFFFSAEGQIIYMTTTGFQPARPSLVPEWMDIVKSRWDMPDAWFQPFINAYAYAQTLHYFNNPKVFDEYLHPALNQILVDLNPVTTTLESMIPAANAFLREEASQQ